MPERSNKPKRPRDLNELAAFIVNKATEGEPKPTEEPIDPIKAAAAALGRLGGLKGGKARAEKLTPEQRKAIAKKAAEARWNKSK